MQQVNGYLSIKEYANKNRVPYDTVAHWVHRGKVTAIKSDGHWYIPLDEKPKLNVSRKRAYRATVPELKAWSGTEIKEHRLALNLGQKELAEIAGVYWITIQRLENEKFESRFNLGLFITLVLMELEAAQKEE